MVQGRIVIKRSKRSVKLQWPRSVFTNVAQLAEVLRPSRARTLSVVSAIQILIIRGIKLFCGKDKSNVVCALWRQREERRYSSTQSNFNTRWGWMVSISFYPKGKSLRNPLSRMRVGTQVNLATLERRCISCPCREPDHDFSSVQRLVWL